VENKHKAIFDLYDLTHENFLILLKAKIIYNNDYTINKQIDKSINNLALKLGVLEEQLRNYKDEDSN
jgi:hypothetical protein